MGNLQVMMAFTMNFQIKRWKVVGHDMLCMVRELFCTDRMGRFQNPSLIKFFPKVLPETPSTHGHRLLLLNVSYKILVLSNENTEGYSTH